MFFIDVFISEGSLMFKGIIMVRAMIIVMVMVMVRVGHRVGDVD